MNILSQTRNWNNIPWISDVLQEYYYKDTNGYSLNPDHNYDPYQKNRRHGEYRHKWHYAYKEGGSPKTMQQLLSDKSRGRNMDKLFVQSLFGRAGWNRQLI